jgi:hypothetical protein
MITDLIPTSGVMETEELSLSQQIPATGTYTKTF